MIEAQYGEVNKPLILLILWTAISNERKPHQFNSKASLTESSASLVKLLGSITTDCNSLLRKTMLCQSLELGFPHQKLQKVFLVPSGGRTWGDR